MYTRKTYDEYQIHTNYGYGWEIENTEETLKDAKRSLQEYRDNIQGQAKLVVKRIPIKEK